MIFRENTINIGQIYSKHMLQEEDNVFENSLFFDLEHYIYKKPICVGVFGCCYFDKKKNILKVTQYMIENKKDSIDILNLAKNYFEKMKLKYNKKYIITFSGNNDFTVINYLFDKYNINLDVSKYFVHIDLQKEYEKLFKISIGLKNLEKKFNICRSDIISGQNLAKTFSKIIKDKEYINRMPLEKKEKILLYNEQDVVSLFHIYVNWNKVFNDNLISYN